MRGFATVLALTLISVTFSAGDDSSISLDPGSNNLDDLFKTLTANSGGLKGSKNPLGGLGKIFGGNVNLPSIDGLTDLLGKGDLLGPLQGLLSGKGLGSGPLESNFGSVIETLQGRQPDKVNGENCTRSKECAAPFSACQDGVCQCLAGFEAGGTNASCRPTGSPSCTYGDPLQKNGEVQACTKARKGSECSGPECLIKGLPIFTTLNTGLNVGNEKFEDSCPDGSYCSIHRAQSLTGSTFMGHCCPLPKSVCPLGKPLANATCNIERLCPSTHYCQHVVESGSLEPLVSVCCPVACKARNTIYKDGRCLSRSRLEGTCVETAQCPVNGACKDGKCRCQTGKLESRGRCVTVTCANDAKPLTNLGGDLVSCTNSSNCPSDGYCLRGFNVCCPKPALKCPSGFTSGVEAAECDPVRNMLGLDKTCKDGFYCARIFKSTDQGTGGLCCKREEQ